MAHSIWLQNASYIIELEDTDAYGLLLGSALGMPQAKKVYAESWGRGFAPLVALDYRSRDVTLSTHLQATSQDNWITTFRQIEELLLDVRQYYLTNGLEGDKAVLSVQVDGQTYPLEYDILDGECNADALFQTTMNTTTAPRLLEVAIPLKIKPFGRPQQLSRVTSGTLNNGGGTGNSSAGYLQAAPNGDIAAPTKVIFQSAAGDAFTRVMLGKKSGVGASAFQFALNCETGTGPGYAVTSGVIGAGGMTDTGTVAVAAAHDGNIHRIDISSAASPNSGTGWLYWEITSGVQNYYGKYRVYLRVDVESNTSLIREFQFGYGGTSGDDILNTTVAPPAASADYLVDLGTMEIPHRFMPLNQTLQSFKMQLRGAISTAYFGGTTQHLDLDALYLMPINEGFVDVQLSTNVAAQDKLVIDFLQELPRPYLLDSSDDLQPEFITPYTNTFFKTTPNVPNRWFALYGSATYLDHDLTDVYSLQLDYHPQYILGRTAAS